MQNGAPDMNAVDRLADGVDATLRHARAGTLVYGAGPKALRGAGGASYIKLLCFAHELIVTATICVLISSLTVQAQPLTVEFDLNTGAQGVAIQFDVRPLSAGVTFTSPSLEGIAPHVVDANALGSGALRFIVYSTSSSPLNPSGIVSAVMGVASANTLVDGMITVENVVVSDAAGQVTTGNPNARPLILSVSPDSYRSVFVGHPTLLTVQAIDPDDTISSASFLLGGITESNATSRPFVFTWTPLETGTYSFDTVIVGGLGRTATSAVADLRAFIPSEISTYSEFATIHFGPNSSDPTLAGPAAQPYGNGIPNLLAYFLGLNPQDPDSGWLRLDWAPSGTLFLRFPRSPFATGVDYAILSKLDLKVSEWSVLSGAPVIETPLGDGRIDVSTTVSTIVNPHRFFALSVSETGP